MFLITRLRDEAHRFAITHHRKRRGRRTLTSQLDGVPGVGPALRKALLRRFGSVAGVRAATLEELAQVRGVGQRLAARLAAALSGDDLDINFHIGYLADALGTIESDSLVLGFSGPGRPLVIRGVSDPSFLYLVMPLNR